MNGFPVSEGTDERTDGINFIGTISGSAWGNRQLSNNCYFKPEELISRGGTNSKKIASVLQSDKNVSIRTFCTEYLPSEVFN